MYDDEEMPVYKFINGVETNRHHPDTFEIPSDQDRKSVSVGQYIKIGIKGRIGDDIEQGERFWLQVTEIIPETSTFHMRYKGRVDNDLVIYSELTDRDYLTVAEENVLDILR